MSRREKRGILKQCFEGEFTSVARLTERDESKVLPHVSMRVARGGRQPFGWSDLKEGHLAALPTAAALWLVCASGSRAVVIPLKTKMENETHTYFKVISPRAHD